MSALSSEIIQRWEEIKGDAARSFAELVERAYRAGLEDGCAEAVARFERVISDIRGSGGRSPDAASIAAADHSHHAEQLRRASEPNLETDEAKTGVEGLSALGSANADKMLSGAKLAAESVLAHPRLGVTPTEVAELGLKRYEAVSGPMSPEDRRGTLNRLREAVRVSLRRMVARGQAELGSDDRFRATASFLTAQQNSMLAHGVDAGPTNGSSSADDAEEDGGTAPLLSERGAADWQLS
jgi:hypothetical protein